MERSEIMKKVNDIFIDVLDNEDIVIADSTTSQDIEEWDSLSHIQLIVAIEKVLGIKFSSFEISSWIDVGEMLDCIQKKMNR
jgi:acyl carrier protein